MMKFLKSKCVMFVLLSQTSFNIKCGNFGDAKSLKELIPLVEAAVSNTWTKAGIKMGAGVIARLINTEIGSRLVANDITDMIDNQKAKGVVGKIFFPNDGKDADDGGLNKNASDKVLILCHGWTGTAKDFLDSTKGQFDGYNYKLSVAYGGTPIDKISDFADGVENKLAVSGVGKGTEILIFGYSFGCLVGNYIRESLQRKGYTKVHYIGCKCFESLSNTPYGESLIPLLKALCNDVDETNDYTSNYLLLKNSNIPIDQVCLVKNTSDGHGLTNGCIKECLDRLKALINADPSKTYVIVSYSNKDKMVKNGAQLIEDKLKNGENKGKKEEEGNEGCDLKLCCPCCSK